MPICYIFRLIEGIYSILLCLYKRTQKASFPESGKGRFLLCIFNQIALEFHLLWEQSPSLIWNRSYMGAVKAALT